MQLHVGRASGKLDYFVHKVYCELARFQSTLGYLRCGAEVEWAQVASIAGYADQSHMIAEFRRFSGMTPEVLHRGRWFHPFIERSARRFSQDHKKWHPCTEPLWGGLQPAQDFSPAGSSAG